MITIFIRKTYLSITTIVPHVRRLARTQPVSPSPMMITSHSWEENIWELRDGDFVIWRKRWEMLDAAQTSADIRGSDGVVALILEAKVRRKWRGQAIKFVLRLMYGGSPCWTNK